MPSTGRAWPGSTSCAGSPARRLDVSSVPAPASGTRTTSAWSTADHRTGSGDPRAASSSIARATAGRRRTVARRRLAPDHHPRPARPHRGTPPASGSRRRPRARCAAGCRSTPRPAAACPARAAPPRRAPQHATPPHSSGRRTTARATADQTRDSRRRSAAGPATGPGPVHPPAEQATAARAARSPSRARQADDQDGADRQARKLSSPVNSSPRRQSITVSPETTTTRPDVRAVIRNASRHPAGGAFLPFPAQIEQRVVDPDRDPRSAAPSRRRRC